MSLVDIAYRTITCDACQKTVTWEHPKDMNATVEANTWLRTTRVIQTGDQRTFMYCSDLCEVAGIETGKHNVPDPPKVEIPQGSAQAQIAAAAAAAKQAAQATEAIKTGRPLQLATS